jgi:hypothetical protein
MNLGYIKKTDKELDSLRLDATTDGRLARKEIKRRKAVGYWDGTMTIKVDEKAEMEVEQVTEYVYAPGVKKL